MATQLARVVTSRPLRLASTCVAILLIAALAGCGSSSKQPVASCSATPAATARPSQPRPPIVPTEGAYFGGFALSGIATQQNLVSSFNDLATQACRPLDLAHVYLRWQTPFPTPASLTLASHGAALLVSWTGTDSKTIISGAADAQITATAKHIASLGWPVFLEFRWEMDRPNLDRIVGSPADYIAAWDRVRSLFAAAGTPNVSWVWCPTAAGFATGRAQEYYPGDNEVDWVCADAYPGPDFGPNPYQPLSRLLRPFLNWAKLHHKPVMIGEFGVPRSYSSTQRAEWLDQAKTTLTAGRQIKAVAYFNNDPVGQPLAHNYSLGSDPAVVAAFRALATAPYFRSPESN
jgi:hypothetical protein